jgi:hypothetical protein
MTRSLKLDFFISDISCKVDIKNNCLDVDEIPLSTLCYLEKQHLSIGMTAFDISKLRHQLGVKQYLTLIHILTEIESWTG